jgi:hypothetical protein
MNTLNRYSKLDEDYYECDDNVNSFKPIKKSAPFKSTATVQDTNTEFKLTKELFPGLTKSVKTVPVPALASLSFSKLITNQENMLEVPQAEEKELDVIREGCYVAVFNKKTRVLEMPKVVLAPKKVPTEEETQVELLKEAKSVLHALNKLHIRRSKEYLLTWGEDEYIETFLSERDVQSAPVFLKTS